MTCVVGRPDKMSLDKIYHLFAALNGWCFLLNGAEKAEKISNLTLPYMRNKHQRNFKPDSLIRLSLCKKI